MPILAGKYTLTADEMAGYKLFDGKGNCNSCHLDGRSTSAWTTQLWLSSGVGQTDTGTAAEVNPVFTCFGSANGPAPESQRLLFIMRTSRIS